MCLILFSYKKHPRYPLIVAANRDEFYDRPTDPLDFWNEHPDILAGRDKQGQGTWIGVNRQGRFAGVTNFRSPSSIKTRAPSRGQLVSDYLQSDINPFEYLEIVSQKGMRYNGFNLLTGDSNAMYYYSNMGRGIEMITPGVYGLSNAFLNTPWPKVESAMRAFSENTDSTEISIESCFDLLFDKTMPPDDLLPETGVGLIWERLLAPVFIESRTYGTRSSAVILMETSGTIHFWERTYMADKTCAEIHETRSFVCTND